MNVKMVAKEFANVLVYCSLYEPNNEAYSIEPIWFMAKAIMKSLEVAIEMTDLGE